MISKGLIFKSTILLPAAFFLCLQAFSQTRQTLLTITTEPGSTVWIDDIRFGKTDSSGKINIKNLGGTRHNIRVRADGFKEIAKAVSSAQGEVNIPLIKTTDPAELAFQEAEKLSLRDREKAAEGYRKAIKLKPNYPAAYIGLARVLSESGDTDGALKAIRDMRRIAPANAEASAIEGRVYKDMGEEAKAVAAFRRSITQARGFQPEAFTGLGLLYKEKAEAAGAAGSLDDEAANYAEAAKDLSTGLKQLAGAPDASVLYQLLGLIYERQKKYDDAIRIYNEFLQRFPDSNEAPTVRSFIEQIKKQMP